MNAGAQPFVPIAEAEADAKADEDGDASAQAGDATAASGRATDAADADKGTGGLSGTKVWRPEYQGRVRSFSEQKGFGFIDCQETLRAFGRDVFIHRFQMTEHYLCVGQEVTFEVELNKTGCPQARNVRPVMVDETGGQWGGMAPSTMAFGMQQGRQQDLYGGMGGKGDMSGMVGMGSYGGSYGGCYGQHGKGGGGAGAQQAGQADQIDEMLRRCSGSKQMWEMIEQYGHSFGRKHVVTALYQLGLCRQYERQGSQASLTSALVDCLVLYYPRDFSPDESARVLWAIAILDEVRTHDAARQFAFKLGEEAARRCGEFSPAEMAKVVHSLSRLTRSGDEDELVGRLTTSFSDYALGGGALPRFPPEELRTWTNFLQEVSYSNNAGGGPPQPQAALQQGMRPDGQHMGGYGHQMPAGPGAAQWQAGKAGSGPSGPGGMQQMGVPPGGMARMGPGPPAGCGEGAGAYGMMNKGGLGKGAPGGGPGGHSGYGVSPHGGYGAGPGGPPGEGGYGASTRLSLAGPGGGCGPPGGGCGPPGQGGGCCKGGPPLAAAQGKGGYPQQCLGGKGDPRAGPASGPGMGNPGGPGKGGPGLGGSAGPWGGGGPGGPAGPRMPPTAPGKGGFPPPGDGGAPRPGMPGAGTGAGGPPGWSGPSGSGRQEW